MEKLITRARLSSEERRTSIVEAASRLFAERGFRGTTTRELAAAVGVTEPVLYEHFKTKKDLYTAIIDAKTMGAMSQVEELARVYEQVNDDREFRVELGIAIIDWYTVDSSFIRLLLFSNLEGHELKDHFHERHASKFLAMLAGLLERRMDSGEMRRVDAVVAARAYLGMIAHYALTGLLFQCGTLPKSNRQVVEEMVEIFLLGMKNPQSEK